MGKTGQRLKRKRNPADTPRSCRSLHGRTWFPSWTSSHFPSITSLWSISTAPFLLCLWLWKSSFSFSPYGCCSPLMRKSIFLAFHHPLTLCLSQTLFLSLQGFSSIFPFPHSLFTASPIFPPHSASSTTGENTPPSFPGLWVMTRLVSRGGPSPLRISSRPFFSSGYSTTEAIFSFCTFSLSFFFFYFPPLFFLCNISLSYYFITLFFFPELLFFKNL